MRDDLSAAEVLGRSRRFRARSLLRIYVDSPGGRGGLTVCSMVNTISNWCRGRVCVDQLDVLRVLFNIHDFNGCMARNLNW